MTIRFSDLQCKEVICVATGQRLGFVTDIQMEMPQGEIRAVIVPCPCRFGVWPGRREDYVIPWNCIKRIGPDIVLVDTNPNECRTQRQRSKG